MITHFANNPAKLNGVRIPVMPPGSKITINGSPRQTTAFPAFQAAFLQKIAARLGISYEQLTMDWTKTNYSSARAALSEVWRHIQRLRATFTEQTVTPIFYAFLEEAFDRGYIKAPAGAPDFWDMPGAYLRAIWIGPGRGYIDPVKEAQASAIRMDSLTSTLEIECAEQGLDYEDVLDQREREEQDLKTRNLVRPSLEKIFAQMSEQNGGNGDEPAAPAREKETA
jgi:lambda family phage portal protein